MAQNHQQRAPVPLWGAPEGSVVQVDGQNQFGNRLGCLLAVFGPIQLDPMSEDMQGLWHFAVRLW